MAWYDVQLDPSGKPIDYTTADAGEPVNVPGGFDVALGPPPIMGGDVIKTTTTAADVRNVADLQARIKAAGGSLTVNQNSSDYIVAVNNGLRFSVTKLASGQYRITDSSSYLILIVAAIAIGILLLSRH